MDDASTVKELKPSENLICKPRNVVVRKVIRFNYRVEVNATEWHTDVHIDAGTTAPVIKHIEHGDQILVARLVGVTSGHLSQPQTSLHNHKESADLSAESMRNSGTGCEAIANVWPDVFNER